MGKIRYLLIIFFVVLLVAAFFVGFSIKNDRVSLAQGEPDMKKMPQPVTVGSLSVEEAILNRRSVREYSQEALSLDEISNLLWAASGITADWGARTAPSAGARYPIDVYLLAGVVNGLKPGIYKYDPKNHALLMTVEGDRRLDLYSASLFQSPVKRAPVSIILCADYRRITPRYKDRAVRYTDIEVGHIGQNIYLQAEALGLATVAIGAFEDSGVKRVLAVEQDPLYIMPVGRK